MVRSILHELQRKRDATDIILKSLSPIKPYFPLSLDSYSRIFTILSKIKQMEIASQSVHSQAPEDEIKSEQIVRTPLKCFSNIFMETVGHIDFLRGKEKKTVTP